MIELLGHKLTDLRKNAIQLRAILSEKESQLNAKKLRIEELRKLSEVLAQCKNLLERCNIASRDFIKAEVEHLTTHALQATLGDPNIQFKINFEIKRGQVEANFVLAKHQDNVTVEEDILRSSGGGIVDIIGFALKIITLELLKIPGPLVLDEPGKHISEHYIDNFSKFVSQVSKTFNRQIIIVTHTGRLIPFASNIIEVAQVNGVAQVTQTIQ